MAQTQDRTRTRPEPRSEFAANGQRSAEEHPEDGGSARPRFARPPGLIMLGAAGIVVLALGLLYLNDQAMYVTTDNAIVTGTVIQLGSPNNGQVRSVLLDIGDQVQQGQVVATLALAPPSNASSAQVTTASVRSTIDGIVVGRAVSPGDAVVGGRALISVVDPSTLWIQAHVDESVVGRVHVGHPAEVTIPALGQVVNGRVVTVGPASTSTAAQLGPNGAGGSAQRTSLTVPVRIQVDSGDMWLVLGTSASVRIRVQD